jgi:hypothetical protein
MARNLNVNDKTYKSYNKVVLSIWKRIQLHIKNFGKHPIQLTVILHDDNDAAVVGC